MLSINDLESRYQVSPLNAQVQVEAPLVCVFLVQLILSSFLGLGTFKLYDRCWVETKVQAFHPATSDLRSWGTWPLLIFSFLCLSRCGSRTDELDRIGRSLKNFLGSLALYLKIGLPALKVLSLLSPLPVQIPCPRALSYKTTHPL